MASTAIGSKDEALRQSVDVPMLIMLPIGLLSCPSPRGSMLGGQFLSFHYLGLNQKQKFLLFPTLPMLTQLALTSATIKRKSSSLPTGVPKSQKFVSQSYAGHGNSFALLSPDEMKPWTWCRLVNLLMSMAMDVMSRTPKMHLALKKPDSSTSSRPSSRPPPFIIAGLTSLRISLTWLKQLLTTLVQEIGSSSARLTVEDGVTYRKVQNLPQSNKFHTTHGNLRKSAPLEWLPVACILKLKAGHTDDLTALDHKGRDLGPVGFGHCEEFANDLCERFTPFDLALIGSLVTTTFSGHRPEVKYLGIIIDRRLTWKPHILRTCATVRAKCKKLDWLLRPRSGLSLTAKVRLFKAIISPTLSWGLNIWGTACNSSIKQIESCQSKILRRIVGSPCQAAIKALSKNTVKNKLTRNTAAALNQCQHHSIRLVWVPGHMGVSGNEMADECARAGSALPASCAVADICKPIQCALSELTRTERVTADRHWAAILGCLVSKALWPRYNPQRTAELLHFNKNRKRLLTGVLTGHCHIGRMAQRYGGPCQDFCRSCGDVEEMESVQHLLCDCPALQRRRNRFLGKPFFVDLGSLANVRLEDLAHFLDSTGWFHGRPLPKETSGLTKND
ncbi:hypothetical protein ACLKA6_017640 [Drosophila palustris]